MTAFLIMTMVGQFLSGYLSDIFKKTKPLIVTNTLVSIGASLLLNTGITIIPEPLFIVLILLLGFSYFSLPALVDSLIMGLTGKHQIDYAITRIGGSLLFAVVMAALRFFVVGNGNLASIYPIHTLIAAGFLVLVLPLKENASPRKRIGRISLKPLFKSTPLLILLTISFFIFIADSLQLNYMAILIQENGLPNTLLPTLFTIVAISEAPVFFFLNRLIKWIGQTRLFIASIGMYAVKFLIYAVGGSSTLFMIASMMQGLTYGIYLALSIYYVHTYSPDELKTTAMSLIRGSFMGFCSIIGATIGGFFMIYRSITSFYLILSVILFLLFFILTFLKRKYPEEG